MKLFGLLGTALISGLCTFQANDLLAQDLETAEIEFPGHPIVLSEEFLSARLAALTKGELKLRLHTKSELGNEEATYAKVRAGEIDLARVSVAPLLKDAPIAKLLSLPFLFRSTDHMWKALDGELGRRLVSQIENSGTKLLAYYCSGSRSFYTVNQPVYSRADFANLRIRVQNSPVYKDLVTMLGARPVPISFDKSAEAFRNNEIDGAENSLSSYVSTGHYKLAKYYIQNEHVIVPQFLLLSKKTWDSLSPDQQKALTQAAAESTEHMKDLLAENESQLVAKLKKEGVTFISKSQIAMNGIEGFGSRLYTRYVTDLSEMELLLQVQQLK